MLKRVDSHNLLMEATSGPHPSSRALPELAPVLGKHEHSMLSLDFLSGRVLLTCRQLSATDLARLGWSERRQLTVSSAFP